MSAPSPAPVVVKKRKHHHRHKHHHHYHHRESSCWFWGFFVFFFLIIVGWLIASFFYPWNQPVIVEEDPDRFNSSNSFVFRKRHNFAAKRTKRTQCKTSEVWDSTLEMCAPIFNTPTAFSTAIMNQSMPVCTSFFGNVCGTWNKEHTNEDRTFSYAYHRNQKLLQKIIESSPATDPIAQFYASCKSVNTPTQVKERQIELKHVLEVVLGDLNTYGDLPAVFGRLARYGYTSPFVFSIERHPTEARMIPFIAWDGFRNITLEMVQTTFLTARGVLSIPDPVVMNKAQRAFKVGKAILDHNTETTDDIESYVDYVKTDFAADVTTYAQLPAWNTYTSNTTKSWNTYFQSLDGMGLRFAPSQTVWVIGKPYLHWLLQEALFQFDLKDWRSYIEFSIIYNCHQFNPSLPNNVYFRKWDIEGPVGAEARIYHRVPRGNWSAPSGSVQCVEIAQHMVPGLVAEAYLRTVPDKDVIRDEIRNMTSRILVVLNDIIEETPWLSQEAKNILKDKIQNIVVRVAEPDEWEVEPFANRLSSDRYDHNMNLILRYRVHRNLQLWHKDTPSLLDRNALAFFSGPLSDVNAYYSGPTNSITILAGILQPPFYSTMYNNVSKHAILGSVIGHELGHAIDHNGLYWDRTGSLRLQTIIPQQDFRAFEQKVACVVKEFALSPSDCPGSSVDYGTITLNEDMADLTGVRLSYRSFFYKTVEGQSSAVSDKRLFWIIFGQAWCSTYTPEVECARLGDDPHARAEYRVDRTLRNIPEFPEAYQCRPENAMYRAKNETCIVYG
jgi:endothelin-converting enzyme/putative endopeptidase